jgi:uncharacterized SAM-binding protein YcdF (DUF218 family)
MFWLKKFASFWLMPLPLCLMLLIGGWALTFSSRRARLGRWLIAAGILLLLAFSNKAVSTWLVRSLDSAYPPIAEFAVGTPVPPDVAACRFVVVLGGGHGDTSGLAALNKLSTSAQARLIEGIRILRVLPGAQLVTCGRGVDGFPNHATILAEAAVSLGVDPTRIVRVETPRDTEEEAVELHRLIGSQPFALVTSAWHLRRATAIMRRAGLNPFPCPADYAARPSPRHDWSDYSWDTESLSRSTRAVYERLGHAWSRLRGRG